MSSPPHSRSQSRQTTLYAILFALSISILSQMNKIASTWQLPFLVFFFRYMFAFGGNFVSQRLGLFQCTYAGKTRKPLLTLNAIIYTSSHALQVIGLAYAPSLLFAILFATVPIWTEIIAFFILKEYPGLKATVLVIISLAALIIMLILNQHEKMGAVNPLGFIILLISCILEAFNNTLIRFLRDQYTSMEINFYATGTGFFLCTLLLVGSCIMTPGLAGKMIATIPHASFLLPSIYLGLIGTFIAGILKGILLQRMNALTASAWSNVSSALSIIFGVVFLHETLHGYQIVCTIVIIASVLGIQAVKAGKAD